MAVRTRDLTIEYGGFTLGSPSNPKYHVDGYITQSENFYDGEVSFFVVVAGATTAGEFDGLCERLERVFRQPYQPLTIRLEGKTLLRRRQSENTALDTQPSIVLVGGPPDGPRARRYRISIRYGLPAAEGLLAGLRKRSVALNYAPSRRVNLTVRATFTAIAGNDARAQYEALRSRIITDATDGFTNDFEVVGESKVENTTEQLCEVTLQLQELIASQAGSSNDDTDIVRQTLNVTIALNEDGNTDPVVVAETFNATYSAWLDREQTTDLAGKWTGTIRDWVIERIGALSDQADVIVIQEAAQYGPDENTIAATMTGWVVTNGIIANRVSVSDTYREPVIGIDTWDGEELSKYVHPLPRAIERTVMVERVETGESSQRSVVTALRSAWADNDDDPAGASGGRWYISLISPGPVAAVRYGRASSNGKKVTEWSGTIQGFYAVPVRAGGPST